MIDVYCERLGPGLLAEPVNALTNLGFLIAAFACWHLARRTAALTTRIAALIGLAAAVGVGSALFHTFATPWALVLDVVPIFLFQLYFLWLYTRHVVRLAWPVCALAVVALLAATLVARSFPEVLNRSLTYMPALAMLIGLGAHHLRTSKRAPISLIAAAGVFSIAIAFRTIDQVICPYFDLGTHFLWHLLSAAILYLAFWGLVANWPAPRLGDQSA